MTPKRTTWTMGAAILSALMLAWSPAGAADRKDETAKELRKLAEARQKAAEEAARQQRKTMEAAAKQERQTMRVEGRQDRKTIEAREDAAVAVAKAQQKAADAKATLAHAAARRPVVVVRPTPPRPVVVVRPIPPRPVVVVNPPHSPLPRIGANVVIGGHDFGSRIEFGLGHGRDCHWVAGRYITRIESVLVEAGHYEVRTESILVESGHYEFRLSEQVEEIVYDSQGNAHKVIVTPGRQEKVWVPDRYEVRRTQVWVPDRYESRGVRVWEAGHWICPPGGHSAHGGGLNLRAIFRF